MNKKKLLLMVAIGLSVSPAVFAIELKVSQTDMRGVQCQYQEVERQAQQDIVQSTQSNAVSAPAN